MKNKVKKTVAFLSVVYDLTAVAGMKLFGVAFMILIIMSIFQKHLKLSVN